MTFIPSALNWITGLDLDFSAQSSQTLGSDTNFTVGGLTWTKSNSASDSVAMAISSGNGLIVQPNSASNISNGTYSMPTLRIPITSVVPGFTSTMPIRIWAFVSASNEAANFDQACFGVYLPTSGINNQLTMFGFRGFSGATNGWGSQLTVLNSNITVTSTSVPITANRVGMVSFPLGILGGAAPLLTGTTVTAGAWPTLPNLALTTAAAITASSSSAISSSASGTHLVSEMAIFLGALRAGSGTAFSATFARLRVDYLPTNN